MALSADLNRSFQAGAETLSVPVAANAVIYNGSIVVQDSSGVAHTAGYGFAATLDADNRVLGVALDAVTGTSTDGGASVEVRRMVGEWLSNSAGNAITAAMKGQLAYVEDDEFVRSYVAGGVNVPVGLILDVDTSLGVLVLVGVAAPVEIAPGDFVVGGDLTVGGGNVTLSVATVIASTTGSITIDSPDGDVIFEVGDAAGVNKLILRDSTDAQVFAVDSNGEIEVVTGQGLEGAGAMKVDCAGALSLGVTNATSIEISRAGVATTVNGSLTVDQTLTQTGAATFTVTADFDGGLTLTAGQRIDTALAGTLNLGTVTANKIFLGLAGIDTEVQGTFSVDQAAGFTGVATFDATADFNAGLTLTAGQRIDTAAAGALNIGTVTATSVEIAVAGVTTTINGALVVDQATTLTGAVGHTAVADFDAGMTIAAAQAITGDGALSVTTAAGALTVDAFAALNLGLTTATSVEISRAGVATTVNGSLTVDQASTLTGAVGLGAALTLAAAGITGPAGADIELAAAANQGVDITLGDNGGVELFRIYDSTPALVHSVDSDGNTRVYGTLQIDGTAAVNATATLGAGANLQLSATSDILGGAGDLDITAGANQNVDIQLGDNGGVNLLRIYDSTPALLASVSSDGLLRVNLDAVGAGIVTRYTTAADAGAAPTDGELDTLYGAGLPNGFIAVHQDTNGGADFIVFRSNATWRYLTGT